MDSDARVLREVFLQLLDLSLMLRLNRDHRPRSMRDLHAVLDAAERLLALLHDLLHVVGEQRLALRRIDKDIAILQVELQLDIRRETRAAHADDAGRSHKGEKLLVLRLDLHKILRLLPALFDHDCGIRQLLHPACRAGKDAGSELLRLCEKAAGPNLISH